MGSAIIIPSRVSLLIISILRLNLVLTYYGILPSSATAAIYLFKTAIRHRASPEFIESLTQLLRTVGVHCRESAGTGPVNLKVVSLILLYICLSVETSVL